MLKSNKTLKQKKPLFYSKHFWKESKHLLLCAKHSSIFNVFCWLLIITLSIFMPGANLIKNINTFHNPFAIIGEAPVMNFLVLFIWFIWYGVTECKKDRPLYKSVLSSVWSSIFVAVLYIFLLWIPGTLNIAILVGALLAFVLFTDYAHRQNKKRFKAVTKSLKQQAKLYHDDAANMCKENERLREEVKKLHETK